MPALKPTFTPPMHGLRRWKSNASSQDGRQGSTDSPRSYGEMFIAGTPESQHDSLPDTDQDEDCDNVTPSSFEPSDVPQFGVIGGPPGHSTSIPAGSALAR